MSMLPPAIHDDSVHAERHAAHWSLVDGVRRLNSSPEALCVVARTFAGATIGGALGATMFSVFDFPIDCAGLVAGAALGVAFTIEEHSSPT